MIDVSLLGVAAIAAIVSIAVALVIIRLPVSMQIWSLIGQQVVMWIGLAEAWLRWNTPMLAQHVIIDIGVIFLAAWPGMVLLDYLQRQKRIRELEELLADELANEDYHSLLYIGLVGTYFDLASHTDRISDILSRAVDRVGHFVSWLFALGGFNRP